MNVLWLIVLVAGCVSLALVDENLAGPHEVRYLGHLINSPGPVGPPGGGYRSMGSRSRPPRPPGPPGPPGTKHKSRPERRGDGLLGITNPRSKSCGNCKIKSASS